MNGWIVAGVVAAVWLAGCALAAALFYGAEHGDPSRRRYLKPRPWHKGRRP